MTEESIKQYSKNGDGLLKYGPVGAQAFMTSSRAVADGEAGWPDVQIDLNDEFTVSQVKDPQQIHFYVVLGRPKSKGTIGLNATAYKMGVRRDEELALVDYNILSDPTDVKVLVEGIYIYM